MKVVPRESTKNNFDSRTVNRGHLISNDFVKRLISLDAAKKTYNYWNKFMQHKAINSAITGFENELTTIAEQCINTNGFTKDQIESNFYFVSGVKPFKEGSVKDLREFGMTVPQLQWSAICCQMKFGETKTFNLSGGYISVNQRPKIKLTTQGRNYEKYYFPIFPPDKDDTLMSLQSLKKGIVTELDEEKKNDINMKVDYFFGDEHPCDTQTRPDEWAKQLLASKCLCHAFYINFSLINKYNQGLLVFHNKVKNIKIIISIAIISIILLASPKIRKKNTFLNYFLKTLFCEIKY